MKKFIEVIDDRRKYLINPEFVTFVNATDWMDEIDDTPYYDLTIDQDSERFNLSFQDKKIRDKYYNKFKNYMGRV